MVSAPSAELFVHLCIETILLSFRALCVLHTCNKLLLPLTHFMTHTRMTHVIQHLFRTSMSNQEQTSCYTYYVRLFLVFFWWVYSPSPLFLLLFANHAEVLTKLTILTSLQFYSEPWFTLFFSIYWSLFRTEMKKVMVKAKSTIVFDSGWAIYWSFIVIMTSRLSFGMSFYGDTAQVVTSLQHSEIISTLPMIVINKSHFVLPFCQYHQSILSQYSYQGIQSEILWCSMLQHIIELTANCC